MHAQKMELSGSRGTSSQTKILSTNDIQEIREELNSFKNNIDTFHQDLNNLFKNFEDEEVVQSFYNSGILGREQQKRLTDLKEYTEKYTELLTGLGNNGYMSDSLASTIYYFTRTQEWNLENNNN